MSDLNEKFEEITDTPDTTAEFDPEDIEKNKVMAVLAYLSWLVLVPLLGAKESKFARFHTNQGIVLAITEIICWFLSLVPFIGWLISLVASIFCAVLSILGIINAATGKAKELPIIGKFRILK